MPKDSQVLEPLYNSECEHGNGWGDLACQKGKKEKKKETRSVYVLGVYVLRVFSYCVVKGKHVVKIVRAWHTGSIFK